MEQIVRVIRNLVCFSIKSYQYLLSPMILPSCRFYPSCSQYALQAIEHHGVGKGVWLSCCRLLRCHPWTDGGYDPVLPKEEKV